MKTNTGDSHEWYLELGLELLLVGLGYYGLLHDTRLTCKLDLHHRLT